MVQEAARVARLSDGEVLILVETDKETDWDTSDPLGRQDTWRFKFLEYCRKTFCTNVPQVTGVGGADVPGELDFVFTHSSLETENITYGPPLGKSDHQVLEIKYKKSIQIKRKRKETTML